MSSNYYALAGLVVVAIAMIIYALWPAAGEETEAIKRRMTGRRAQSSVSELRKQAKDSVAKKVLDTVAPIAIHPGMKNAAEISKLRMRLASAGFRDESTPTTFLASKTVMAILVGIGAIAYVWIKGMPLQSAAGVVMIAAGLGFLAPDLWLSSAISKRCETIRNGLPDVLDMLVISVESGLGLDAAFQRVGDEMKKVHPALSEELQIVTLETQMGIPRAEALGNLATRSGLDEVRSLTAIINQAERFGTSIAKALRNQSDALRVKRRQAAEERAQKTTVKLMAPLILFIFPAILVVLAGPAALKMMEALSNTPGLL
ncbi:MAG: type II secretion system F family protein [Planctomycetes bacterium]|nr:type II secretion system F family protein [Planctomycetota bacterium]MBI3835560.1 type II secretion system F family protein [Planctomycetota bacterium]